MRRALELAERGEGFVHPNPLVGAVLVKDDRVIGEGWHACYGEPHAERNALEACAESARGATLYVTLEPCCHHGKTPPCTEAIVGHGVARVVVAMPDPNPLVAGKGLEQLRAAGIAVEVGVEESAAREQNRVFLHYMTSGLPWVVMKTAMTLDGKIATRTGDSKWVTGTEARVRVHEMRSRLMGIVVGIGTVVADDPLLTVRLDDREVRQPIRIVVDSNARLPIDSQIVRMARAPRSIMAYTHFAPADRLEALQGAGVELLLCEEIAGLVDIRDLCRKLGELGINSLLLEGGGTLNHAFLSAGMVNEVCAFVAPKIIGGMQAKTPVEGEGIARMRDAVELHAVRVEIVGEDVLIQGVLKSEK